MSETPLSERQAFVAARKQTALAGAWRYDQGYEDALQANPAALASMSANYQSIVAYYKSARDAAEAEGIDITGGSR